jgi:hypothetical protein
VSQQLIPAEEKPSVAAAHQLAVLPGSQDRFVLEPLGKDMQIRRLPAELRKKLVKLLFGYEAAPANDFLVVFYDGLRHG